MSAKQPETGLPDRSSAYALPSSSGLRWPDWSGVVGLCVLAVIGLACFAIPLRNVDPSRMNGLGLISVLPLESLIGAGLLTLAFVCMLGLRRPYPAVLAVMLVVIVVCLDGVTLAVEREPRLASAYQVAGIAQYLSQTGHLPPGVSAYSGWPGFFALIAFATDVIGRHDLIPLLRLWPVAMDLLWLPPLFLIMRNMRATWQARWFAAFLFSVGNWVGQDYFSPQAFSYLLYLIFIAILLSWFRAVPRARHPGYGLDQRGQRRWRGFGLLSGELPPDPVSYGQQAILLTLLIAIFAIASASYLLTAVVMIAASLGLVLVRRCTLTGLPVLLGVILITWVSFAATPDWSGRLAASIRSFGNAGGSVVAGISDAITPQHLRVLDTSLLLGGVIVGLAAPGLVGRRLRFLDDRSLLVLTYTPILALGLSHSANTAFRVYLFALPAACLLAAYLFFPATQPGARSWLAVPAAAACAMVFVGAFFVARYGNEAFEQVPVGELAAMDYVYSHDASGARLLWLSASPASDLTPAMPWQYQDPGKIDYLAAQAPQNPASISDLVSRIRALGPGTYLMTTQTQEAELQQTASYPPNWGGLFRAQMTADAGVRVVLANHDAVIYTFRWPAAARVKPLPVRSVAAPRSVGHWTMPAGLIVAGLLLAILVAREFIRVCLPALGRFLRPLTWMSLPLIVVLCAVVAERFVLLR
jgi:hypothetical protein